MRRASSLLLLLLLPVGCDGGDESSSPSSGGSSSSGGSTSTGGTTASGGAAGDDGGTNCALENGKITPTGSFDATVTSSSANLDVPAPGKIPCQIEFYASGGANLGDGSGQTGNTAIICHSLGATLFNGFTLDILYRPKAGTSYPMGVAGTVPTGTGTYKYNGQATLTYEEGPVCDTLQDKSKQWSGLGAGTLTVDSVNGASVTFTLTGIAMTPTSGQLNYKGTGNFDLAGTGSGDVVDK